MGRIIGLIGCTCLVIVALRLTNLQYTDHTLKGGEDRVSASRRLSPREHYKLGKEMFLRGKYRDAVQHLAAATDAKSGLSVSDRRQAVDYLARARTRLQEAADATVRGQSETPWDQQDSADSAPQDPPAQQTEAFRSRVDRLMGQAKVALQAGQRDEAIRLARMANQVAKDARLTFDKKELTPAQFLVQLQAPTKAGTQGQANPTKPTAPDWAADDLAVGSKAPARQTIQQTSAQVEQPRGTQPAASSRQPLSAREQAISLLAQAREDMKAQRFDEARQKALIADELDVIYDLFDDRPELLLSDLDRLTNTTTIARNRNKAKAASPAVAQETAGDRSDPAATPASATAANIPADKKKQQARRLLELARKDIENGNLDAAQARAEEAEKLNAAYALFEDMPELALKDIAARRAAEGLVDARNKNGKAPTTEATAAARSQALALLAKARQALKEDRLDEARQLAIEADRLKASYDLFDDRPEIILQDVARHARLGPTTPGTPIGDAKGTEDSVAQVGIADGSAAGNVNSAAARQNLSPTQVQALELLRQARQLMKAERFEEARAKALEAEQMNVAFPVFADSPDLVLNDLDAKLGNNVASRRKPARDSDITTANTTDSEPIDSTDNPFGPGQRPGAGNRRAADVAQADSPGEISSASDLYNRGMREMSRGNRQAAYASFLAAYQTGQKLDYVRAQRLQDYLRELAPRRTRTGIQQAGAQDSEGDIAQLPGDAQPAPLDAAQQEQMIRFDRLRAEVQNAVFKAERLRSSDPEAGLTLIDQTMAKVEGSELPEGSTTVLMKLLNKTRSSLQNEMVQQKPNLEQKKKNREVEESLAKQVETDKRIEQELAKLVEEFNDLFKQQRFAEAEIVAKKAKALAPKEAVAEQIYWKAVLGRRVASNDKLQRNREDSFWRQLDETEQAVLYNVSDSQPMKFGDNWKDINARRKGKYGPDNRKRDTEEMRIEQSLTKRISLHEDQVPLAEVMKKIGAIAEINIHLDPSGLEEEAATSDLPVTINVDGIQVKSALSLILSRYNLAYMIENEVLKITSRMRTQGELVVRTYPVADLVIPIPDALSHLQDPLTMTEASNPRTTIPGAGHFGMPMTSNGFAQIGQNPNAPGDPTTPSRRQRNNVDPDFNSLTELITSTIAPDSWDQVGGPASIRNHETTLSLVVRQTQKVHEEIVDLLDQLRRLQDLQVTIEVRFVTVSDYFFERIGVDFNFNIQPTTGYVNQDNSGLPLQPFGSVSLPQFGLNGNLLTSGSTTSGSTSGSTSSGAAQGAAAQSGGALGQSGGQAGAAGQAGGQAAGGTAQAGFFGAGPLLNLYNNPQSTTIVGMKNGTNFTQDLSVPFTQGSFQVGVPTFGNYNPQAGMEMGMAILSDIEAFFFIQAAQGDQRNNLLFAPKITVFNGQTGIVRDNKNRPFVVSLVPTVGFASVGFQPVIQNIPEGITLTVTAVVSSDRRFVRLTVIPTFISITDVFTFSYIGGGGQGGGGQAGAAGGNQQGGQGGFGGGQFGGGGGGGGGQQFGIGGGFGGGGGGFGGGGGGGQIGGQGGQIGGQGGQGGAGGQRGGAAGTITIQQPVTETVSVITTVSVPDGGTILLGGIKRLKEGRNMSGVPILNKIPYLSRLFKNTGVGRETESLMLMVTPRIIIQEEEEELLGIPPT